jgi:peptidoglycan/LPS O-acetylase OafA/YrhL
MKYNPALDGLRAVAVLAVVAYHAGLPVPAGFVGVDIFFVISGYLISRLLHDEIAAKGRIDFLAFYARRARRILPALLAVMLVTLGLSLELLPDASDVARSAAAASAFVANVFFQAQTSDYWAQSSDTMPLLHLWSLSVEEQFYLAWPVVLLLARRKPAATLAMLALASFALAEWMLYRTPSAAFYQMPARAWELAAGGLIALRAPSMPKGSAWLGLAAIAVACVVPLSHFPGAGALPAVVGAGAVIAAAQQGQRPALLEWRPVIYVGLISYSLYLWHWPLLALDRAVRVGETPLGVRMALVGVAFVLASMSYRYVETPARRLKGNRRAVAAGLVSVIALSGSAWALVKPPPTIPEVKPCHPGVGAIQQPRCVPGSHRLVLWGDSIANVWTPLADRIARNEGLPAVSYARDGCPVFDGVRMTLRNPIESRECAKLNRQVVAAIRQQGADTVVITSRWPLYIRDDREGGQGLINAVNEIRPYVRRIVIIGPTPTVADDGPKCARAGERCAVTRDQYLAEAGPAWRAIHALQGIEVIDIAAWFCRTDCPAARDGVPLYRDTYHPSDEAVNAFLRTKVSW